MASEKSAEATLPWRKGLAFRPFSGLLDHLLHEQFHAGQLRLRIGDSLHANKGDEPGPQAEIQLHRPLSFARRVTGRGHLGFGESYLAGDWDSPDLTSLIHLFAVNEPVLASIEFGSWLGRLVALFRHHSRTNTKRGSRRNIAHHYDLGNAFYRLWLDPGMTYSAALFDGQDITLEQAQRRKYQSLLEMLGAEPGAHVLEIGCGWGGFAREAVAAGHRVTGLTLSSEQLAWASETLTDPIASGEVDLHLRDYRDMDGQFDHIASIEMFEAVGERYWPVYMNKIRQLLRPGGRAALQVITIDEQYFDSYRSSPDFIQKYIFPGGMLPTPARFDAVVEQAGLRISARRWFGQDYARTLAIWHQQFMEQLTAVRGLGYDETFIRMWRYYLAYCEAGFRDGRIDVMQVVLETPTAD
ncbi:SAM-dependent methyltransferase [Thiorhodovibrio frisius]|uniref:Methyltransferase, cyclopropane fatty acid synthase n=1 Tax=Thiorhodovibrio frisius TaxID=631362 RepID=H8Z7H8_9GAMM|nr:cyclopropane-fatty-acyl-phospholipid synthase family protein [Thiorhodovibrio frisius]EIC20908.1 methyltransferase, cyclopropane fatty acid synthase [Thiorhodovibrio frisius]WPL21967.1 Cyclopropane-fatty-acyl-phospholipid synthase [Thiorhodovibrio frisius]